jgi:hypothetical protein
LRLALGRLRVVVPWPQLGGSHAFSVTTALLPAALTASLIVPALAVPPSSRPAADIATVLVTQASRPVRSRPPSLEPLARAEAPAVTSAAPAARPTRPVPAERGQPSRDGQPETAAPPEGKPAAVTKYDFENDEVEGTLARPDDLAVFGDTAVKHASLIEIRREFTTEIAKMLEDF